MKLKLIFFVFALILIFMACNENEINNYRVQQIPYEIPNSIEKENEIFEKDIFINELGLDNFNVSYNYQSIPYLIKSYLNSSTAGFSLANPNEAYEATDLKLGKIIIKKIYDENLHDSVLQSSSIEKLPDRQLHFFGWNSNIAVLSYSKGGFCKLNIILLFKHDLRSIQSVFQTYTNEEIKNKEKLIYLLKTNNHLKFSTDIKE